MNISINWLKDWLDYPKPSQALANDLIMGGLEVENIVETQHIDHLVIARVLSCDKHPNADRLKICQVDIGQGQKRQIICGADNVRAGIKVVCALPGALLGPKIKIKESKIRSALSQGMLCSASEIGYGDEDGGIIILDDNAKVGDNASDYLALADTVLTLDITPNRGDCFSFLGIARELSAYENLTLKTIDENQTQVTSATSIKNEVQAVEACPRYLSRVIENIDNQLPTPRWLVNRLIKLGQKPHAAIVDITNYVMLELGQPLHAFDLSKIKGGIIVRYSKKNETLTLLNNKAVVLDDKTLVIADSEKVLAIAGVMGGLNSAVSSETKAIVLESAFFTPALISGVARKYGLHTDASLRFERGVDAKLTKRAMLRVTQLITDLMPAAKVGEIKETCYQDYLPKKIVITLKTSQIKKTLGVDLDNQWIERKLSQLGFLVKAQPEGIWQVTVPSYRFDVTIAQDLIEELARLYGYDKLPTAPLSGTSKPQKKPNNALDEVNAILVNNGYQELINYSFIDANLAEVFNPENKALVRIKNPISSDMSVMRPSLLPKLLAVTENNKRQGRHSNRFFETGLCFHGIDIAAQSNKIAAVICGFKHVDTWRHAKNDKVDFYDLKAILESLLAKTNRDFYFKPADYQVLQKGQSAKVLLAGDEIGYIGKLSPEITTLMSLPDCYVFEVDVAPLLGRRQKCHQSISHYQKSVRDLSILIDEKIIYQAVLNCILALKQETLISVKLFDTYQDDKLSKGKKSLALSLCYQAKDRTLTDSEIEINLMSVYNALVKSFAVERR